MALVNYYTLCNTHTDGTKARVRLPKKEKTAMQKKLDRNRELVYRMLHPVTNGNNEEVR